MKTLKKTLCLVLALVMALSLMSVAAASNMDGYTDAAEVDAAYVEAVEVLMGLGIVNGMSATEIGPEGYYTRAQAAKIATYLAVGPTVADMLPAAESFTDVPTTHWASKYIAYCAGKNILNGVSATEFAPEAYVTGYQFAKMLLAAMGYGANNEFVGNNWAIAAAQWALPMGLFAGDSAAATNEPITRQQAMLIAYNALYKNHVDFLKSDEVYDDNTDTFAKVYSLNTANTASADQFGRPATEYTTGTGADEETIALIVEEPVYTTSAAIADVDALKKALGTTKTITVTGAAYTATGKGVLTEVYATGTDAYKLVCIPYYVTILEAADIKAATAEKAAYVILDDGADADDTADDITFETAAFAKGDVIIYTLTTAGKVASAVKAESFTGSVTAVGSNYVRIDGEKMEAAKAIATGTTGLTYDQKSYTYYVDEYGYIVAAVEVDNSAAADAVVTDYLYLISSQAKEAGAGSSDLFGEIAAATEAGAKAKIVDVRTGEIKTVDLGIVSNDEGDFYANKLGAATTTPVTDSDAIYTAGKVYEYAVLESGEYVILDAATVTSVELTKDSADIDVANKYATAATKLVSVVLNTKSGVIQDATITTKTGIASFPETATSYDAIITANATTGVVSELLVVTTKEIVPEESAANYAIFAGAGEVIGGVATYGLTVNGETTYYPATAANIASFDANDVVTYKLTDGKISTIADATVLASTNKTEITVIDDTFFVAGTAIYFADSYTVVNADDSFKADTIAVADKVTVYGATEAEFIVIDND